MNLTPREKDKLLVSVAAMVARGRLARGVRLNHPEAIALITDFVVEGARDGRSVAELMAAGYDYVIDAIDSVRPKAALIAWCRRNKIPLITTGGAGGQVDPTQIQVTDLNKTFNDPLAAKVRSLLRRDYGFSRTPGRTYSVPCVFSTEQLRYPKPDGTVCQAKGFVGEGVKLDCAGGFGAVMMVTASFGMAAAAKLVDKLVAGARRPAERQSKT